MCGKCVILNERTEEEALNRIRKWTSLLALLLALTLGVPAGAEDAYLYMPWAILWHGEEYY